MRYQHKISHIIENSVRDKAVKNLHIPRLTAIVAMSENRVIGKNNQLLWHLPQDLRHFKQLTLGKAVLMGRKTYDSIGKVLPNRLNLVLTRDSSLGAPDSNLVFVRSFEEALNYLKFCGDTLKSELFIIGGAEIYKQLLPKISCIHLTIVHHHFEGDVYFPELNAAEWHEVSRQMHTSDEAHAYAYSFITLERK